MTKGSRAYALGNKHKNLTAQNNSRLVQRYLDMGLIPFGKTSLPEFAIMGTTEPKAFGACRNPWNTDHSTGGSSGGSAAVVASGVVSNASAGDGGGSIRIPASACGIFGLKPTRGRTPHGPSVGEYWDGAAVCHVLSRSVRDSAKILDLSQGVDPSSPYQIPSPTSAYAGLQNGKTPKFKIAYSLKHPLGSSVSQEVQAAVLNTVKILQGLGHSVEEEEPDIDGKLLAKCYITMVIGHVAADVEEMKQKLGDEYVEHLELPTRTLGLLGKSLGAAEFIKYKRLWGSFAENMASFHERYDFYLTPSMARTPVKIGELEPSAGEKFQMKTALALGIGKTLLKSGLIDEIAHKSLEVVPFTQLANLTGAPAMSVPLYWTENSLPIGSHFSAAWGREDQLFSLAFQLEIASPWKHKDPMTF